MFLRLYKTGYKVCAGHMVRKDLEKKKKPKLSSLHNDQALCKQELKDKQKHL